MLSAVSCRSTTIRLSGRCVQLRLPQELAVRWQPSGGRSSGDSDELDCQLHVEPWAYLRDVLVRLAAGPDESELLKLLPDKWLLANPKHRWKIDAIRRNSQTQSIDGRSTPFEETKEIRRRSSPCAYQIGRYRILTHA